MILLEHVWSRKLLEAVTRANGIELMNEWIAHEAVLTIGPGVTGSSESGGGQDREGDPESRKDA
jgi:hypothetical protein